MNQYIALLRGINVGGRNLKMAEIKACLEQNGYQNVITVLQTGNIILDSPLKVPDLKTALETLLQKQFGYPAQLLICRPGQMSAIISRFPFETGEHEHRYIIFMESGRPEEMIAGAPAVDKPVETVQAAEEVVYWRVQKGLTLDSPFGKYMNKMTGKYLLTTRNVNTLEKILKKCRL
ncbi:MAG TPA: DUF1697 domain-containing protein [Edaphocola sp.]|nr:DUF1697 domain-containing protein [Edaphocola sp.]